MTYFANCARKLLSMTSVFMLINTEMVACTKLNWQFQLPAGNRLYRPQTFQISTKRLLKGFWAPIFLSRSYVTLQFDVCLLIWGIFCQVSLPVEELLKILQRKKRIKWYITSRIKISLLLLTKQKLMEKSTWTYWEDMLRIRRIQWPWRNVAWCCSELFCWKIAANKRGHRAIPWRWPNCHQSKTCCPIARTWVGIDRNMPLLQIAIKFNWMHRGYELQHNASVPGSTCTSVSRGSLFNFRIHIESFTWKGFSRHNQLHTSKHNSRHVFSITTMLCDKLCGWEKFFAAEKNTVEGEEFSTGQFKEIFHILL